MRVFVLGATGAIGGHAIPDLVAEGHTVSELARSPEKSAELTAHGATPVRASLFDSSALAQDFAGFGMLFAREGNWRGRQLISRGWIDESMRADTSTDSSQDEDLSTKLDTSAKESR